MVQDYFGENGTFVTNFKSELEYSYRHGIRGRAKNIINYNSPNHDSYRKNGDTRFFWSIAEVSTMRIFKKCSNQKGQSAIEFLVTFVFVIGFVFLFVRLVLNFGIGYLAHYATFMASRVYMSHDNGHGSVVTVVNSAKREALQEFKKYKLDIVNLNPNKLQFNQPIGGKA